MAGIPEIIMQGASMVNQAIQHQQQMQLERERFKLQKAQWEDSLQWRQQAMEAQVKTVQEENKLKELQLAQKTLQVQALEQEQAQAVRNEQWYRVQMREDDPEAVQKYGTRTNTQLQDDARALQRARTDMLQNFASLLDYPGALKTEYEALGTRLEGISNELQKRVEVFSKTGDPNLDKSGTQNALQSSQDILFHLDSTASGEAQAAPGYPAPAQIDQKLNTLTQAFIARSKQAKTPEELQNMTMELVNWAKGQKVTSPASIMRAMLQQIRYKNPPNAADLTKRITAAMEGL